MKRTFFSIAMVALIILGSVETFAQQATKVSYVSAPTRTASTVDGHAPPCPYQFLFSAGVMYYYQGCKCPSDTPENVVLGYDHEAALYCKSATECNEESTPASSRPHPGPSAPEPMAYQQDQGRKKAFGLDQKEKVKFDVKINSGSPYAVSMISTLPAGERQRDDAFFAKANIDGAERYFILFPLLFDIKSKDGSRVLLAKAKCYVGQEIEKPGTMPAKMRFLNATFKDGILKINEPRKNVFNNAEFQVTIVDK